MILLQRKQITGLAAITHTERRTVMEDIKKEVKPEEVENVAGGYNDPKEPVYGYCPYTTHRGCTNERVKGFKPENEECVTCYERCW